MASAARPSYGRDSYDPALERTHFAAPFRRISWGAIIAGITVVLVLQLLLMLLGLAVGASTIDPAAAAADNPQASTFGMGAGVWWLVSTAIAIFAGAWVAGRLAGSPTRTDGMLHGVVTWSAATLLGIYLLTSTLGSIVGGAFGALGSVASTMSQSASSLTQGVFQVLPDDIRAQAEELLNRAPAAGDQAQQQANQARQAAGGGSPVAAVQRIVRGVQEGASPQDRQAAVSVISQQAGIPPQEAEQRLSEFQTTYQQYSQQAAEQARQTAEATANTVSQASFWAVVALVVGAVLAALGGSAGTPRDRALA